MRILISCFILTLIFFLSCTKDKALEPVQEDSLCSDTVSFSNQIQPLITDPSCNTSGCHNASSASAGYVFDNHVNISSKAELMLRTMKHESGFTPMPYNQAQLSDSLIQMFDCWIQQGKLNN